MELRVDIQRVDDRIEGDIWVPASERRRSFSGWLELCQQLESAMDADVAGEQQDGRKQAADDGSRGQRPGGNHW